MARPRSYATSKVEEWRSIDLAHLRRWRMLAPRTGRIPAITWRTEHGIDLLGVIAQRNGVHFVRRNGEGHLEKLFVPFAFTPTKFGGWRAWFRCSGCLQGCRVLYGVNSLRCRKCRGLKYQSQYDHTAFRLLDRASKIRCRLGKPGSSGEPLPPKPRHMRWRTYRRLEWLVSELEAAGWAAVSAQVYAMRRKLR